MKISFFGAGAIGSMTGGLLKKYSPELDVTLIGRGEHGAAMQQAGGVQLVGPWGDELVKLEIATSPEAIAGSDLVFLTVKSQHTVEAMNSMLPYLGNSCVVSIQNGINDHLIASVAPEQSIVSGMTTTNMATVAPGRVSLQLDGVTILGPPDGKDLAPAASVVSILNRIDCPGLDFVASREVKGTQYNKLMINALGYASCISDSNFITQGLAHRRWRRVLGMPLVAELSRVLEASNIRVAKISGRSDIHKIQRLMRLFDTPIVGTIMLMAIRKRFERQPIVFSLLQDLRRRRATEVDHVNGEFVRLANLAGCAAPISSELVAMVHEIEAAGGGQESLLDQTVVLDRIESLLDSSSL